MNLIQGVKVKMFCLPILGSVLFFLYAQGTEGSEEQDLKRFSNFGLTHSLGIAKRFYYRPNWKINPQTGRFQRSEKRFYPRWAVKGKRAGKLHMNIGAWKRMNGLEGGTQMTERSIRLAAPLNPELVPSCGFQHLYRPEGECDNWYLRYLWNACRIVFGTSNLSLQFVPADSYGLESTRREDFSPNSSLALVEAGKADITTQLSLTLLRSLEYKDLGSVALTERIYVFRRVDSENAGIGIDFVNRATILFMGVLLVWHLCLKKVTNLFENRRENHRQWHKVLKRPRIIPLIHIQKGCLWLILGIGLQYLATRFSLLFNVPTPVAKPFGNLDELDLALMRKEARLIVLSKLAYSEYCPVKGTRAWGKRSQLMASICKINPPIYEENVGRALEMVLSDETTQPMVLLTDTYLPFYVEMNTSTCMLDYIRSNVALWQTFYYSNTSLEFRRRIRYDDMRALMKQLYRENLPRLVKFQCEDPVPTGRGKALSFRQLKLLLVLYPLILVFSIFLAIGERIIAKYGPKDGERASNEIETKNSRKICGECLAELMSMSHGQVFDLLKK